MDFAKNFTLRDFLTRVFTTTVYLLLSSFVGSYFVIITSPAFKLIFSRSTSAQGFFLTLTGIFAMLAVTALIACRAAFSDTENLKYSVKRNIAAFFCSCTFIWLLFLIFSLFKLDEYFSSHFFTPYYMKSGTAELLDFMTGGLFSLLFGRVIVYTALILLMNFVTLIMFYLAGRQLWILKKKRNIKRYKNKRKNL